MILEDIAARRARDAARRKRLLPADRLVRMIGAGPRGRRDFAAALAGREDLAIIGEIKRASPSRGILREPFDPAELARQYAAAGVQAVSVLTEPHYFMGCGDDLPAARSACALPVLRKDFLVDPWQLYETAALGADAALLIAALLPSRKLRRFLELAAELSLDALVETHDRKEMDKALDAGARILGVNNRNLRDFTVSLRVTEELAPLVPSGRLIVSESGIRTAADARRMREAGAHALLVGEAFMRSADIPAAAARLQGTP